jgi:Protein of unknown function (DUF3102)
MPLTIPEAELLLPLRGEGGMAVPSLSMPPMVIQAAADIRALMTSTAQNLVTIGLKLQAVKAALPHGQWEAWLRSEFDWSLSSALKMMQVAERFKSVRFTDLRLDVSSLYLLAAPSTPPAVQAEAVVLAQHGEAISVPRVKALINKHRGVVTLEDYKAGHLLPMVQDVTLTGRETHAVFNRTNEMVDWAWWTWNPLTGCELLCDYCYARDIGSSALNRGEAHL